MQQEALDSGKALTRKKLKQYVDNKSLEKWIASNARFESIASSVFSEIEQLNESGYINLVDIYPQLQALSVGISNYYMTIERDYYKAIDNQ